MMIRYNDMTLNSNELTALFDMTEEFVTDAVKQKTKAKKEVQKSKIMYRETLFMQFVDNRKTSFYGNYL